MLLIWEPEKGPVRRDDAAAPPRKCLPPYNSTVRREVKRSPASGGPWKMAEKKGERNGKRPCFLPDSMYNNPQQIKHPLFFKKTTLHGSHAHADTVDAKRLKCSYILRGDIIRITLNCELLQAVQSKY